MENVELIALEVEDEEEYDDDDGDYYEEEELTPPRVSHPQENIDGDDELNEVEIDGLCCSICYEAWTNAGEHQICCLPCGHIYGFSCINKWIRQHSRGKCPQCKRRCTLKDVILLYAERLCVLDAQLQKKVRSLEAKCASLEQKKADCCKKEVEAKEREADLHLQVEKLTEKTIYLERLLEQRQRESFMSHHRRLTYGNQVCSGLFTLQSEYQVDSGRYFDMDSSGELMIVARRVNGTTVLTKISLIAPNEREDIHLPCNTKTVKSLSVNHSSRLALLASLGKKLSIVSTESNNVVLTYDLPAPAWSCSWDIDTSHYVYTGLQNGMVLGFDIRQTNTPLESISGLTCNPVHTLISVASDSSSRTLLSASQIGICEWNIGTTNERPYLIPESNNPGQVCISLAHSDSDDIVASFRPKIETSTRMESLTTSSGSHVFYKRSGAQSYYQTGSLVTQVDSIRLPKSCIIKKSNRSSPMFVAATSEMVVYDISMMEVVQRLKTPKNQIWDVKCIQIWNSSVLACLSGDMLQLYTSP